MVSGQPFELVAPVFVVGSGRSGTSLVRNLLNLDPEVAIAPESHFLDQWLQRFADRGEPRRIVEEMWPAFASSSQRERFGLEDATIADIARAPDPRSLFAAIVHSYAGQRGARVVGEKTPAHFRYVDRLLEWFPDARVVFVVRDPRSVVASLTVMDASWASGSIADHVALWRDAAKAAIAWHDDPRVTVVRYEDLVADPLVRIPEMHTFLTARSFDPAWLQGLPDPDLGTASGSLRADQGVSDTRIAAWQGRLSVRDADAVAVVCRREIESLGYDVPAVSRSRAARLRVRFLALQARRALARATRAARDPSSARRRIRYRRRSL
jgi:hypothetical protein